MSNENELIDRIVTYLGIPQKPYLINQAKSPDLTSYPVEFDYLTRCLHQLGSNFMYYRLVDTNEASISSSIGYGLTGQKGKKAPKIKTNDPQEICNLLSLNIMIIGPDESNLQIYYHPQNTKESNHEPYVILYQSYESLYYPLESLNQEVKQNRIFYRQGNNILQQWLPESKG